MRRLRSMGIKVTIENHWGLAADPLAAYRASGYEARVAKERTAAREPLRQPMDA